MFALKPPVLQHELSQCDEALGECARAQQLGTQILCEMDALSRSALLLTYGGHNSGWNDHLLHPSVGSAVTSVLDSPSSPRARSVSPASRRAMELEEQHAWHYSGPLRRKVAKRLSSMKIRGGGSSHKGRVHHREAKRLSAVQQGRAEKREIDTLADAERQEQWRARLAVGPLRMDAERGDRGWQRIPAAWQQEPPPTPAHVSAATLGVDEATARLLLELQYRDVLPEDYDLLGRLDEHVAKQKQLGMDPADVQQLPEMTVAPGSRWAVAAGVQPPPEEQPKPSPAARVSLFSNGLSGCGERWTLKLWLETASAGTTAHTDPNIIALAEAQPVCAVCQMEWEDGEAVRCLPVCSHVFHRECIDEWLLHSGTCCPIDKLEVEL